MKKGRVTDVLPILMAALLAGACGRQASSTMPGPVRHMFNGKVTMTLPETWLEQRHTTNGRVEMIQFEVPDKNTEDTPDSANAIITAEPIQAGVTVTNFGNPRLSLLKPEEGDRLLTDFIADASWRTTLSIGHQGSTPYVVMDRFGVEEGVMVAFRVAHPVLTNNSVELAASVSNFNKVVSALKIARTNRVDSEMRIDKGSIWLRHFSDHETNWMSGTGMVYRRFQPDKP